MESVKLIQETFLGHLSDREIKEGLESRRFALKQFEKGQVLHSEGEPCHHLELLLAGDVVSMLTDKYGNELVMKSLTQSDVISGSFLFGTSPTYPLTFLAKSKGILLQIDRNYLFDLISQKPQILRQFLLLISDQAFGFISKLRLAARRPLRSSILDYLYVQSLLQNSNVIILPISKAKLANKLGVLRTSVSREFSKMAKEGLIKIHNNKTIELIKDL
ncbi:MAG: Crp/Fnr family transcriptional regulator [Oscillospiraceae bacterium]